jgi:hypothetical protein
VEIPVYLYAGRLLPGANRILLAVGASSVTHPIVCSDASNRLVCLPVAGVALPADGHGS